MADFSHLDQHGKATMVDISGKAATERVAKVSGNVSLPHHAADQIRQDIAAEITTTARIAGIQAAKKTSDLIPLCHQVPLSKVSIAITWKPERQQFEILSECKSAGTTGVEMEAFTAAQIAALTIYDMIKAICPEATLGPFALLEKTGGKTGIWQRSAVTANVPKPSA